MVEGRRKKMQICEMGGGDMSVVVTLCEGTFRAFREDKIQCLRQETKERPCYRM
jgi:hypothetical protein